MPKFSLSYSDKTRYKLTKGLSQDIVNMYSDMYEKIRRNIEEESKKTNISAQMRVGYLKELQNQIVFETKNINKKLGTQIPSNMFEVAQAVTNDNIDFAKSLGFTVESQLSRVATDVVANILQGTVYKKPWNLSDALWSDLGKTQKDIQYIVAQGTAMNKSVYDIAKDLEKYVNPSARKSWEWSKVYPGTRKKIDYNAQRLARTMVSHAYQQSLVANCKPNPFVQMFIWLASNSERTCQLCHDRDGQKYKKHELPLDHPNGMCTYEAELMDDDEMIDKLASWAEGKPDKELDNYEQYLQGKKISSVNVAKEKIKKPSKISQPLLPAQPAKPENFTEWIDAIKRQTEKQMLNIEKNVQKLFSEDEKGGLKVYTGNAYRRFNQYLREKATSSLQERTINIISQQDLMDIKNCQSALSKAVMSETQDIYLRRGTDLGDLAGFMAGNFGDNLTKLETLSVAELNDMFAGSIGEYAGFTSTSSLWDRGFGEDVEFVYKLPKGTKGASSIMNISRFGTDEGETLLNAGTRVRILQIERATDRHMFASIRVFAEILG